MSYGEALNFIYSLGSRKITDKVRQTLQLSEAMGSPHEAFQTIHVTGTCGKGSVSAQCANMLYLSGYRTGLMASPHILDYKERFQVNFELIPEDYLVSTVQSIKDTAYFKGIDLTFSMLNTVLGFCFFRDRRVQYAVVEVGAGGTSDTTNIVNPVVSAITSVGLDHCSIFGNTIEDIAIEKSGVIKPGKPCVLGCNTPSELLIKIAAEKDARINQVSLQDSFIAENIAVTREIARVLNESGHSVRADSVEKGVLGKPPLRFQEVKVGNTLFVLDAAHNSLALKKVLKAAHEKYKQKINVVLGAANIKNPQEFLQEVAKQCDSIYLTSWHHANLTSLTEIGQIGKAVCNEKVSKIDMLKETLETILRENKEEVYIVCGSFYLLEGAVRELRNLGVQVNFTWRVQ